MIPPRPATAAARGLRPEGRGTAWRVGLLTCLGMVLSPTTAAGEAPCSQPTVCRQSSPQPAEDWFRHGLEALAEQESRTATCSLEKASTLDPAEDGHNLTSFVKPMVGGVKPLPRDCALSSAPLDRKKYFPRLYLAKAYLEWALRSQPADKRQHCEKALAALSASRDTAPLAKVRQQWERREKIDKTLRDSRCCDLLPEDEQCGALNGGAG